MKECFLSYVDAPPARSKCRIYISRRDVGGIHGPNRRISNEEALLQALEPYDVESVAPETLPIKEQLRMFRDSELMIGAPGSGLANSFLATDAALVALTPNGEGAGLDLSVHDWGMSKSAGNRYWAVYHGYSRMPVQFEVDIERTVAAVERALAELPQATVQA